MTRAVLLFAALVTCAIVAGTARADGDPASDFLVLRNTYLPFATPSAAASSALESQVADVYHAKLRIKVAVIASKEDLGAIPSLFDKPTDYGSFLGAEIAQFYIGPLLIVMPAGYGIYDGGRSVDAELAVLGKQPQPASASSDDLTTAATNAVAALFKAGALVSRDILKPYVTATAATVAAHRLSLSFYLYDDSGGATVALTVTRSGHKLFARRIGSVASSYNKANVRRFAVSAKLDLAGARLCLFATDPTGNHRSGCKTIVKK